MHSLTWSTCHTMYVRICVCTAWDCSRNLINLKKCQQSCICIEIAYIFIWSYAFSDEFSLHHHFVKLKLINAKKCAWPSAIATRNNTMNRASHHPTLIIVQLFAWAIYTIAEYNMHIYAYDTRGKWSKVMEVVTVPCIFHTNSSLSVARRIYTHTNDMHLLAWPSKEHNKGMKLYFHSTCRCQ